MSQQMTCHLSSSMFHNLSEIPTMRWQLKSFPVFAFFKFFRCKLPLLKFQTLTQFFWPINSKDNKHFHNNLVQFVCVVVNKTLIDSFHTCGCFFGAKYACVCMGCGLLQNDQFPNWAFLCKLYWFFGLASFTRLYCVIAMGIQMFRWMT